MTPFSLLVGLGVVVGYALLGATWLVMRTEGSLQDRARTFSLWLGAATVAVIAVVSAATPFLEDKYWERWFTMPSVLLTAQVPLLVAVASYLYLRLLRNGAERTPFLLALGLFLLARPSDCPDPTFLVVARRFGSRSLQIGAPFSGLMSDPITQAAQGVTAGDVGR